MDHFHIVVFLEKRCGSENGNKKSTPPYFVGTRAREREKAVHNAHFSCDNNVFLCISPSMELLRIFKKPARTDSLCGEHIFVRFNNMPYFVWCASLAFGLSGFICLSTSSAHRFPQCLVVVGAVRCVMGWILSIVRSFIQN